MARIRSASEIADKWVAVTPGRTAQFEQGVRSPLADWESNTKAAEKNYEQGVQASIINKRFGKGVDKAGTEKWQQKTLELGVSRWGPGVAAAGDEYESGFSPFRDVIEKTVLPPRFPRGDVRNFERVKVLGTALHEKKIKG